MHVDEASRNTRPVTIPAEGTTYGTTAPEFIALSNGRMHQVEPRPPAASVTRDASDRSSAWSRQGR